MNLNTIEKSFKKMGATVVVDEVETMGWRNGSKFDLDIRTTKELGEHYYLRILKGSDLDLIFQDIQEKQRHMVLKVKDSEPRTDEITSFLVGHDERHWFAAGIPGSPTTVNQAKNSLMPAVAAQAVSKVEKHKNKHKRHNKGFKRQGEWFFIPAKNLTVDKDLILKPKGGEPIVRQGGGKPHMVQEMYRIGGRDAWVRGNQILTDGQFNKLKDENPLSAKFYVRRRVDAKVYVKGWVRHPDHATITLKDWHEVIPNTETTMSNGRSVGMSFID